jgi:hypothetical protein
LQIAIDVKSFLRFARLQWHRPNTHFGEMA